MTSLRSVFFQLLLRAFLTVGMALRAHGRYVLAGRTLGRARFLAQRECQAHPDLLAEACNCLGLVLKDLARYDEARSAYQSALQLLVRAPEGTGKVASLYHNLAGVEHALGNYAAGEVLARSGIAIREQGADIDHGALAADSVALAALLIPQQKLAEATSRCVEAISVFEVAYGADHLEVASARLTLGTARMAGGQHSLAASDFNEALRIREKRVGPHHPDVALVLNNLALCLKRQGNSAVAAPHYQRALRIMTQALGSDHPRTRTCRENLRKCLSTHEV